MSSRSPPEVRPVASLLGGGSEAVNALAFLGAFHLASGSVDGTVRIYDLLNQTAPIAALRPPHLSSVLSLSSMQKGEKLLSSEKGGVHCVWDMNLLREAPVYRAESGAEHFCNASADKFNHDPHCFCTPSVEESSIIVWDMRTRDPSLAIRPGSGWTRGMVTALLYMSASSRESSELLERAADIKDTEEESVSTVPRNKIIAGFESGDIFDIDLRFPRFDESRVIATKTSNPILSLDISSDRRRVVSGGGDSRLAVSTMDGAEPSSSTFSVFETQLLPLINAGTSSIKFRCDDRIFVSGHWDGTVRVYSTCDCKLKAILRHHRESVFAVAFASEANVLNPFESSSRVDPRGIFATAGKGGVVALWDIFADKMNK